MRGTGKSLASAFLTLAFASTALPAMAAPACGPLKVMSSLDITMLPSQRPSVPIMIGDSRRSFLVDTGGFLSMVTKKAARELDLPTTRSQDSRVVTVNGASSDVMVRLPSVTVGTMRQEGAYFFLDPDESEEEFDGLLGGEMLQNFDADFDFAKNKLNLISQDHCAGQVTYWPAPKVAIVPFSLDRSNHITLRMQLDGKRVNAILDTGASGTVLNLNTARRTFNVDLNAPDVEKAGELTGGYTANVYQRQFKTISFEGVTVNNPMIVMLPDMMTQGAQAPRIGSLIQPASGLPDIILGMNVLSQLHLYIAYKERKLYITEAGAPAATVPAQ